MLNIISAVTIINRKQKKKKNEIVNVFIRFVLQAIYIHILIMPQFQTAFLQNDTSMKILKIKIKLKKYCLCLPSTEQKGNKKFGRTQMKKEMNYTRTEKYVNIFIY